MGPSIIYVVSGANRGLGLGLVVRILETHLDAFVYAGARDPQRAIVLQQVQEKYPTRMAVVRLVSADVEGNAAVAKQIEETHGRVDTVIANAGIGHGVGYVIDISPTILDEHFLVNVTGTIVLFQSLVPLLRKSPLPRFVPISSSAACFDGRIIKIDFGSVAYGATKAALNWATRKIHFENEWLVTFPMCPGPVDTDLLRNNVAQDAKAGGVFSNLDPNFPTPETAAESLIKLIDASTREKDGGLFTYVTGDRLDW